jgi:hypothetical protein
MLFAHVIPLSEWASLRKVKNRNARPFPGHPRLEILTLFGLDRRDGAKQGFKLDPSGKRLTY